MAEGTEFSGMAGGVSTATASSPSGRTAVSESQQEGEIATRPLRRSSKETSVQNRNADGDPGDRLIAVIQERGTSGDGLQFLASQEPFYDGRSDDNVLPGKEPISPKDRGEMHIATSVQKDPLFQQELEKAEKRAQENGVVDPKQVKQEAFERYQHILARQQEEQAKDRDTIEETQQTIEKFQKNGGVESVEDLRQQLEKTKAELAHEKQKVELMKTLFSAFTQQVEKEPDEKKKQQIVQNFINMLLALMTAILIGDPAPVEEQTKK